MQRDGALTSLWQSSVPTYQTVAHKESLPQDADVVIVGGGITGITTAYLLQQGGKKCVIVEAHTLGFGTTGGTTAHINTFMDNPYNKVIKDFGEMNAQVLAQGAKQALELIEKNVQELKINCEFIKLPGFIYAVDDDQQKQLDEIAEASKKVGVEMITADTIPVPIPFVKSITVPGQAQFNPVKYIYALAKAFEEAGGIIVQHCRVTKVEEAETKAVHTQLGEIKAPIVIYATHIPPGINLLHLRCAPYRSYAIAVKLEDEKYPEALAYDLYDPYHYFRTQEVNGELYLIAGGEDHKTAHEENTNACFRNLEAYVRKFYNVRNVSFQWSSQYYEPADGLAYIGHLPMSAEGMYVATGFGGNGMTYGTLSAIVLSEQILHGYSRYTSLFDPTRVKPVAGFTAFVKENADVAAEWIKGKFSKEKLNEIVALASGEAKVVKFEGRSLAIFKDENGSIHAVNPTCTHMLCTVGWNNAEKSWDCPCHGARYDMDGNVLTAPSTKGLELVDMKTIFQDGEK